MRPAAHTAIACCVLSLACAGAAVKPVVTPVKPAGDALLVLPGFGYSRAGEQAFRSLAGPMAADGVDLYVPTFVARGGLEQSRARLRRFIRDSRLDRYAHVHVFAFIAGGWAFNPIVGTEALPNLSTVVYDRSPYQERAPRVARDTLPLLAWVKFGPVIFDVARTPYPPAVAPGIHFGVMVETVPTSFIRRFARAA
ncbi:MAG: hypothetical protein V7647_418, partial [Acidobacteriota bacterium]